MKDFHLGPATHGPRGPRSNSNWRLKFAPDSADCRKSLSILKLKRFWTVRRMDEKKVKKIFVIVGIVIAFMAILLWPVRVTEFNEELETYYENIPFEYHARWQIFTENVVIPLGDGNGAETYAMTQNWTDLTVWVYNDDSVGGTFSVEIPTYESGDGWESRGAVAGMNQYIEPDNFAIWEFTNTDNIDESQRYELPKVIAPTKQISRTRTVINPHILEKRIYELLFGF